MKRDLALLRQIMIAAEDAQPGQEINNCLKFDGKEHLEIADHVAQLDEQGFIQTVLRTDHRKIPNGYVIQRITSKGHDFLQFAKNDTLWNKVMTLIKTQAVPATIGVVFGLLKQKANEALGLPAE